MGSRYFFLLIMILASVSFVVAQPVYEQETNVTLSVPCTINGDVCNASATCVGTVINPEELVLYNEEVMTKSGAVFELDLNTTDTATNGEYRLAISCTQGSSSTSKNLLFTITPSGEEIDDSKATVSLVLLAFLVLFLVLSLVALFKTESYMSKFIFYWVSHILAVGIFFIAWQTSANFLTLSGGVTGLFKVLWYVAIYSVFPMLILSLAWVFYIHTYNEHFQKLLDKGYDMEEAFRLTNKKKGWLSGN